MQNLGYITDSIFHQLTGIVEEKNEYFVVRNPNNPTYYWGNLLILRNERWPLVGTFRNEVLDPGGAHL
jgi:hypothetical protein